MKKNLTYILSLLLVVIVLSACGGNGEETNQMQAALSATTLNIQLGESSGLSVLNYDGNVSWSSSSPQVATVDESGAVRAVSMGSVAVTATLEDGKTMTCVVKVQPGESAIEAIRVTSIYSDVNDITIDYAGGNTVYLKATCTPSVSETLNWSSSNELLAQVDANGNVTVYGNGVVEIKATALNGVSGTCTVRIKNVPSDTVPPVVVNNAEETLPVVQTEEENADTGKFKSVVPVSSPTATSSIIVSDKNVYLNVGESFTLTYEVSNGDAGEVTWVSSDKAVAIVQAGRIVAIGEGRAVISAVTGDGAVASCDVAVGEKEIKAMKKEVSDNKR